jgi:hypothetical protein
MGHQLPRGPSTQRGSYAPDNGHERRRSARQLRANFRLLRCNMIGGTQKRKPGLAVIAGFPIFICS